MVEAAPAGRVGNGGPPGRAARGAVTMRRVLRSRGAFAAAALV
jgi:hypothetical protein